MTVSRIGYYGKLPARADFVSRRLPEEFVKPWDAWIQSALSAGESWGGEVWRQRFLASPTWRFALPAGTCGRTGWTGALRPSVDAVGRCFPFVLAAELPGAADILAVMDAGSGWFETLEAMAGATARPDFDLGWLDRPVPSIRSAAGGKIRWPSLGAAHSVGLWHELPSILAVTTALRRKPASGRAAALWWTAGTPAFGSGIALTAGLIPPAAFPALIDGSWGDHGWTVTDGTAQADDPEPAPPEWDRTA
ncbi:type VI secretion system-associated protein TagF (plasmid) [Skermanella rosea]|uniref:type VI secretion system-associated protein TagF n=1 Tax=Skermanella rosea TaxID=1817965 RepID=UPI001931A2CE|nr:type VI secretion system-associated protein TagF [Skermanella rosea]UEM07590.1 type VI secretion system-associated protein TagF [Skermanella rosea]